MSLSLKLVARTVVKGEKKPVQQGDMQEE